ncbi:MAG: amino acid--tRNA ligase-related protein, partial [Thermoprotei archaeon]
MREGVFEEGGNVTIQGHLEEIRDLGGLKFLILRDIKGRVQVVFNKKTAARQLLDLVDSTSRESVVKVVGRVKKDDRAPMGFEIEPTSFEVISKAESPLPIDIVGKTETNLDTRLDWRFLDLRKPEVAAIFKIQSKLGKAIREFFDKKGFYEIHTSKIVSQATEGGANVFPIFY